MEAETSLPVLCKVTDTFLEEPTFCSQLGMIFSKKPLSNLTNEHGFFATLRTPYLKLPNRAFSGPKVLDPGEDSEVYDFLRFKSLKEEEERNSNFEKRSIRCLIDLSTDINLALESAVGVSYQKQDLEILIHGDLQIDKKKFLLGGQKIMLLIHERLHIVNVSVVKELFPSHKSVGIQVVLGREFLSSYPGFVMQPTYRQGALDLVPWDCGYRGDNFEVNSKGELIVYVCGQSRLGSADRHYPYLYEDESSNSVYEYERGAFGVFFGPDSSYNMSMITNFGGSPLSEVALMEGIIAIANMVIKGGLIYGNPTFTTARIRTDSQLIVDMLNPGGTLREYREKDWENSKGKKIGFYKILEIWDDKIAPNLESERIIWMKENLITFEKVDKKAKGLQAARHLAQSALDASNLVSCGSDFGGTETRVSKRDWDKRENSRVVWISPPEIDTGMYMFAQDTATLVKNRKLASKKASREVIPPVDPTPSDAAHTHIAGFFPPGVVLSFKTFASAIPNNRKFSAMQLLEISDWSFAREVLRITKKKRGLDDTLDLFKEKSGRIRFFHKAFSDSCNGSSSEFSSSSDTSVTHDKVATGDASNAD